MKTATRDDSCHCGGRNGEHWHRCPDKPSVSLETRLEMTTVAMDVLLSNACQAVGHSNPETTRAVAQALSASPVPGVLPSRLELQAIAGMYDVPGTPDKVLLKAARLIREVGWTQWQMEDDQGRICLSAAVLLAGRHDVYNLAYDAMALLLSRIQREYSWIRNVPEWNDSPYGSRHGALRFLEMAD